MEVALCEILLRRKYLLIMMFNLLGCISAISQSSLFDVRKFYFLKLSIDTLGNVDTLQPLVQRIIYTDKRNYVHWYEEPIKIKERKIEDVIEIVSTKELRVIKGTERDTFYHKPEKFRIIQKGKNIYYRSNKNKVNLIQYSLLIGDTIPAYTFNDFYADRKWLKISYPGNLNNIYLGDTIIEMFSSSVNCFIVKSLYCCDGGESNNIREIRKSYIEKASLIPIYVEIKKELVPNWFSGFREGVTSNIIGYEKIIPLATGVPKWLRLSSIEKMLKEQIQKDYQENKELEKELKKLNRKL